MVILQKFSSAVLLSLIHIYPGPDFVYVADLLKSDACQFTVLENHKDALDATRFGQRFSDVYKRQR